MNLVPASRYTIQQLTEAYNQTRVDYLVPMPMSAHRLMEYIQVYDVSLDDSVVAEEGGEILGLCMLGVRGAWGWATRLGVLPTCRRHGAGQALMEYVIQRAVERGCQVVYLEVIVGNVPAYRLFTKLGFRDVRELLVLRRPPGLPHASSPPPAMLTWLDPSQTLLRAAARDWRPAWTNQTESLANARTVGALHLIDQATQASGWISYQTSPLQLRRVLIAPDPGHEAAPAYSLLYHLHSRFPLLDTVAENVPADSPHLPDYKRHGYVESFRRLEMELPLGPPP